MAFRHWQVGLEIGNSTVRALAVQRRRRGWLLRHWWQHTLPAASLNDVEGLPCPGVGRLLAGWRKHLPGSISLRVCLPAHLFSQRRIKAPDRRLREPERGLYIASHSRRHFPEDSGPLLLDYRDDPLVPHTLLVTAARQTAITQWQSCLSAAGLDPQIMDFMPCALRCMARHAGLEREFTLIHGLGRDWCWVSPLSCPLEFGFVRREDTVDFVTLRRMICRQYPGERGAVCPEAYYSSNTGSAVPEGALPWPPFDTFWQIYPPAPPCPQAFLIAGGLALRQEDI
ncbi:pilus assembly protein HofM [Sodalis sp. dw_96]|uniref:pilus assembly protein HofM n=1 Tax=Sodalis sp. dw_96 TaxID=2719794 RepID=UPI001BD589CE|nr:pilus assembly protein HofM [Sodalis sp. dw_96]